MNNKWITLTLLSLLLTATFIIGCEYGEMRSVGQEISPDTITVSDTIWNTDTFNVVKPIPKYITKLRTDTVYTEKGDTIELKTENKHYQDTVACQQDTIILQSFITGINSSLDSVKVELKKQEITNTIEITKYVKEKPKLFKIQPQIGVGYGILNKNFDMYVGLGVGINL